ncbi:MAG: cation:proton antiporter [Candidatus Aenigmatarchaeota archaeon]
MVTPMLSVVLLDFVLVLVAARLGGWFAEKIRQPSVLGEIIAGIMIGPSLLGLINPAVAGQDAQFSFQFLLLLGEIGAMVLLFQVGLESSLHKMMKSGSTSFCVALIGVVVPALLGFVYFYYFLGQSFNVSIFVGGTLTATSVGITMRVLKDMGKMKTNDGRIILGAAVIDDVMGLVILSMVVGLIGTTVVTPGQIIFDTARITIISVIFMLGSLWLGMRCMPKILGYLHGINMHRTFIVSSFVFLMIYGYLADMIGLAAIVGAFAAGLVFETLDTKEHFREKVKPVANLLVPIFFVMVGARMNIAALAAPETLPIILVLLAIAIAGKMAAGLGALRTKANKLAIGIGMIPRGEVGLMFAAMGLTVGLITMQLYSALVIVILITTLITPPFFARAVKGIKSDEHEEAKKQKGKNTEDEDFLAHA